MSDSSPPGKTGLFRRLWSGSSEKTKVVRLPINAYGKLPIYKDFISSGLTDAPAREFRAWLDKGFSHRWSTDDACRDTEIPPHSFLLRMPDSKGCAAGSLWGSSDEGGLRKFPFALFFSFPKDHGAADPVAAVEYLGEVERRASELRYVFGPGASLSSFYQAYRGAELDLSVHAREQVARDFRSELSTFTVGEFAESLFGAAAARAWPELLAGAASGPDGPGAVRVPLGGRLPRAREVEFWLFWLDRQDPKGRRPVTGVLYPHGHNPGRAIFFFRDVRAEDFLLLHPTRTDLPQVHEPLCHLPPEIFAAHQPGLRATLSRESARSVLADRNPSEDDMPAPETERPGAAAPTSGEPAAQVGEAAAEPSRQETASSPPSAEAMAGVAAEPSIEVAAPPSSDPEPADAFLVAAEFVEEAPFPDAELPFEPTTGGRLSQILALDAALSAQAPQESAGGTPSETPPEDTDSAAPEPASEASPPVPVLIPLPVAVLMPVPVTEPILLLPATEPILPVPATAESPASLLPAALPPPPALPEAPVAAAPLREPVPQPPGWERPLAVLLER